MGRKRLYLPCLIVLMLSCLLTPAVAWAHGDPPPTPPTPPKEIETDLSYPVRWSWLHWWEANRDPFLEVLRQGRGQKPEQGVIDKFRKQAVDALTAAMESNAPVVRGSAVVALGQMREIPLSQKIQDIAAKDKDGQARAYAMVGLGLMDTPEAQKVLLSLDLANNPDLQHAKFLSLGLTSVPNADVVTMFQKAVRETNPAISAVSAWSLCRKIDPANADFLFKTLRVTESVWVSSDAILSLGYQKGDKNEHVLVDILLADPSTREVPILRQLQENIDRLNAIRRRVGAAFAKAQYDKAYQDYVDAYRAWQQAYPGREGDPMGKVDTLATEHVSLGLDQVYWDRLRASAAIALGHIDTETSRAALRKSLTFADDGFSQLFKAHAIMSLGLLGDPEAVPAMIDLLNLNTSSHAGTEAQLKGSLSGFAALALGLYARPQMTVQGPQDRPAYDKVCRLLAEKLADKGIESETRAACAMGLGLTRRTENLRYLQLASGKTVNDTDDLLIGYTLLARSMLGDTNVLEPAGKYLAIANDRTDTSGILGRRAAVLGLGVLGSQECIPLLVRSWDLGYYVNRETPAAMALCEAYNAAEPLCKLLNESPRPLEKAFAARCLGELFTAQRPGRLAWLLNESNYMIRNNRLTMYKALANEFMYVYLLPAFGKQWQ